MVGEDEAAALEGTGGAAVASTPVRVVSAKVMVERDERTVRAAKLGVSKGFGFVEFAHHIHVRRGMRAVVGCEQSVTRTDGVCFVPPGPRCSSGAEQQPGVLEACGWRPKGALRRGVCSALPRCQRHAHSVALSRAPSCPSATSRGSS